MRYTDNKEAAKNAIQTLQKYKMQESDSDHRAALEDYQEMIAGIYDLDYVPPRTEELNKALTVVQAIDPEAQNWHDEEYVRKNKRFAVEAIKTGIRFSENPEIW